MGQKRLSDYRKSGHVLDAEVGRFEPRNNDLSNNVSGDRDACLFYAEAPLTLLRHFALLRPPLAPGSTLKGRPLEARGRLLCGVPFVRGEQVLRGFIDDGARPVDRAGLAIPLSAPTAE